MSNEVIRVRQQLLTTQSDDDKLIAYLTGKSEAKLSPKLREKLTRMEACAELIRKYGSRRAVAPMLVTRFGKHDQDYSLSTAYRDYESTTRIFGTTKRDSRDFFIDVVMEMMFETHRAALADGDWRTCASVEKNLADMLKTFFGNAETIDWEKVQPPQVIAGFLPELLNVPLPTDWEAQAAKLIARKRRISDIDAEDAQEVA